MAERPWTVLKHGPLEKLEENLWSVEGRSTAGALRRRMALVRLDDGRIVVHSAMALEESAMKEIEAWGTIAFVVVPNGYHRLDAPAYKKRYPQAEFLCPAFWQARVAEVVPVDGTLERLPKDGVLSWSEVPGTGGREVVLEVTSGQHRSLVLNDILFDHPHRRGFGGLILRLIGSSGGPRVTRVARTFLLKDKAALRQALLSWADRPGLVRLVVSHSRVVSGDVPGVLRAVAATL